MARDGQGTGSKPPPCRLNSDHEHYSDHFQAIDTAFHKVLSGIEQMTHIRSLDGLRAVAIMIVFLSHCGLEKVVPGGFGVTIFFFLSGYLITSLLRSEVKRTGNVDYKNFYFRRTIRIWPALYITVALATVLGWFIPFTHPASPLGIFAQLAFVSNYPVFGSDAFGVPMPLWSLAVEEHFYLIFPLIFGILKLPPRKTALLCGVACFLVLVIRVITAIEIKDLTQIYYWSHTRIDSILFGCCLALWQNPVFDEKAWKPSIAAAITALCVLAICLIVRDEFFRQTLRYTLQGSALFVLFSYIISGAGWLSRMLSSRVAQIIALYSYTLYLVHVPVIIAIHWLTPSLNVAGVIVTAGAASIIYAAAMHSWVEAPLARWRKRRGGAKRSEEQQAQAPIQSQMPR